MTFGVSSQTLFITSHWLKWTKLEIPANQNFIIVILTTNLLLHKISHNAPKNYPFENYFLENFEKKWKKCTFSPTFNNIVLENAASREVILPLLHPAFVCAFQQFSCHITPAISRKTYIDIITSLNKGTVIIFCEWKFKFRGFFLMSIRYSEPSDKTNHGIGPLAKAITKI